MSLRRSRSVKVVQVENDDGTITDLEGKDVIEKAILSRIHDTRFYLAEQAPICQGTMRGKFGYLAINDASKRFLSGTYHYPAEFDQATREIMEECACIHRLIKPTPTSDSITRLNWQ